MTTETKIEMFRNELDYITDTHKRKFAELLLAYADDYFFYAPASSSGNHHPSFSSRLCGLVRHTRCVAFFAKANAESLDLDPIQSDLLVIAALAHDIKKLGDGNPLNYTAKNHPELAAKYVMDIYTKFGEGFITLNQAEIICDAVLKHMGKWANYPMPQTDLEKALQSADYIASRKELMAFDFKETAVTEEVILEELHNFTLGFGKHSGKTLREVQPTGYLDWVANEKSFSSKFVQNLIREYLERVGQMVLV